MAEDTSEGFWMDDFIVETKNRNHPKKTKKETEKNIVLSDDKYKVIARLFELSIPKSAQSLLTKLVVNGQLIAVNKILHRKKNSIVISGKVNKTNRNFPLLSSDDVIIKVLINGNKGELCKRAYDEYHQVKYNGDGSDGENQPTFLLRTGNIIIESMIGQNGKPAPTLKDVLNSNQRNIAVIYNEFIEFWCKIRHRPFHPTNNLYHDGKWWRVGSDGSDSSHLLSFYRTNLKRLIDFFCQYGLTVKEAEDGFMKCSNTNRYYWDTEQAMRGMTRKRSFFSIMYM